MVGNGNWFAPMKISGSKHATNILASPLGLLLNSFPNGSVSIGKKVKINRASIDTTRFISWLYELVYELFDIFLFIGKATYVHNIDIINITDDKISTVALAVEPADHIVALRSEEAAVI